MAKISVIIPTYNREKFIGKAIDSVLNQSFTDYEIIVIDDGSTDNTNDVLKGYGDKIKYCYQENSGVSAARNLGIKAAKGEWVAFLDSDDEWKKDYLTNQMEQVKKYPEAVGHITNAETVLNNGERRVQFEDTRFVKNFNKFPTLFVKKPIKTIVKHTPWFLQETIFRKEVLLTTRLLDHNLAIAEDLDLMVQMALKGPFTFNKNVLVEIYRREEKIANLSGLSRKNYLIRYQSFLKAHENLVYSGDLDFYEKIVTKRYMGIYLRAVGNVLLAEGNKDYARHYYWKALTSYPSLRSLIRVGMTYVPVRMKKPTFSIICF